MDKTAYDRMPADIHPSGEFPDGSLCAYCLDNDGECLPHGWNLIGPICWHCLKTTAGRVIWPWRKSRTATHTSISLLLLFHFHDDAGGGEFPVPIFDIRGVQFHDRDNGSGLPQWVLRGRCCRCSPMRSMPCPLYKLRRVFP